MAFPTDIQAASYFGVAYNNLSTTLSAEASASATTIYVASTTNFTAPGWGTCEDEVFSYTGLTSGSFTGCVRGADNTTAAIHASGKAVSLTFPAIMWTRIVAELIATQTKLGITGAFNFVGKTGDETIAGVKTLSSDPIFSTGGIVTQINTVTLTNKRITKRVATIASSAAPTPDSDITDIYTVTALAEAATFGAPTGTPTVGQMLLIRIKDNGTARALAFNAIYRAGTDVILPTTTVISKTMYALFIYNVADSKWDLAEVVGGI